MLAHARWTHFPLFQGIEYSANDLRLGLIESIGRKIGSKTDQLLLLCYQYDPATGRYGLAIMRAVRVGGILTLLALGSFIYFAVKRGTTENSDRKSIMNGFRLFPERASTVSHQTDALYLFLCIVSAFFSILICALMFYFAIKYRRRSAVPRLRCIPTAPGTRLDNYPAADRTVHIFLGDAGFSSSSIARRAIRWMCMSSASSGCGKFSILPGGARSTSCTCPLASRLRLLIASQDVIHGFYIPAFRIKQDAIPGPIRDDLV